MVKLNEKALALLKGKNFAVVATVGRDGSPQTTTVWVDTDGDNVLVNTAIGRVKERNLIRDPRIALTVFDRENPYVRFGMVGKVVKRITTKEADDHIDKLSLKYTGNSKYQGRANADEKRVILVIQPTRLTAE